MKKSLLRFMLLVTGLLLGVNVALADYEKVTSTTDITDGEYLIVYEADNVAFNGALETLDAVSNTIAVEIADGKIVSSEVADAATFTVDVANGTLKSASGKYIGVSGNSNGLKQTDNATTYINSFSIDTDGNAVIVAVFDGSTMSLQFNKTTNQTRFRYYKTTSPQQPIALYKKIDGSEAPSSPILTLTAPVGNEVSLTFGVYDTEDEYSVDFGDGTLQTAKVGVNNAGPVDPETGQTTGATVFKGTVAGDGTIKVYGKNDVWYLNASGAMPTALDQSKLMNVVQMVIAGVDAESVTLPAYEKIDQFSFNNSPVKTVDVSKATSLKSLSIVYSSLYEGEMNLESIDLQNNTELTDLSIQSQKTGVNGKLKEIDLSKNTKLASIYLPNNSLTNVTLPSEFTKKDANDESVLAKVTMFLNGNKLTAIDGLDKLPAKSQVNISNNLFTLATLPVKPANVSNSKYTYAPQAAYEVAESLTDLDLSSQLSATGILTEPVATSYSFKTVSGTALVEGTDYEVAEPGKFHFIKEQTEKVYGVMATTAFPKFTGNNEYKTTEFTVVPGTPSGISNVTAAKQINGKYYNLQGVEIQKPIKGVYIQNGRKVVVK